MDNLLNELKENSTILCNSLSDSDVYQFLNTVQAPPKSQAPNYFNFSNIRNYSPSPKKSTNLRGCSRPSSNNLKSTPTKLTNYPVAQRSSDKKQANPLSILEEWVPKNETHTRASNEKRNTRLQGDFFTNSLGIFGNQTNDDPNCCSSEYYYNQSTEEFLLQMLSFKEDEHESEDVYSNVAFGGNSLGLYKSKPVRYHIKDIIEVNKVDFDFGTQLSGKILEETFEIKNNSSQVLSVEVVVNCFNQELQQTEEYVYSIRSNYSYDYSEKKQFTAEPHSTTSFKIAIKIPKIRLSDKIRGSVRIVAQELEGELSASLQTQSVFPKLYCPKQLYSTVLKRNFIKVAVSKDKTQEKKISLKNDSNVPVTLELGFYKTATEQSTQECSVYPKMLTIPANGTAAATVLFKPSNSTSELDNGGKSRASQEILCGKAKDSCLVYSFPLWIETY